MKWIVCGIFVEFLENLEIFRIREEITDRTDYLATKLFKCEVIYMYTVQFVHSKWILLGFCVVIRLWQLILCKAKQFVMTFVQSWFLQQDKH